MGSIQKKRPCTLGTQCSRYGAFGEPEMVSTRYSTDGRCDKCTKLGLKPNPALKEHEELFRAAHTLYSEGVTDADIIMPTLAFAAQSQKRPILKSVRDRLSEVEEGSKAWAGLKNCFIRSFGPLGPESVKDGTLFVRARPVVVLVWDSNGDRNILVEVYSQSRHAATPEVVEQHYEWALTEYNIPQSPYGLEIHEVWYAEKLQIIVGPSHPRIYDHDLDDPNSGIGSVPWEGTFPPPGRVRDHYASALRGAKEGGFGDILVSKQKGKGNTSYEPYNLIFACIAWYLQEKGNEVVNECLATLPDTSPIKQRVSFPIHPRLNNASLGRETYQSYRQRCVT
jgi:hypothetical protein